LAVYVYILRSEKDRNFYTGCTVNLKKRLNEHNAGRVRSTSWRRPLELVYWEACKTRSEAMRRERQLKRIKKIKKRVLIAWFQKHARADIY